MGVRRRWGGYQRPREIWLPRESEPSQLQVFTWPEEEEPRVQICAGADRGYGLSTTVSLGHDPMGEGGGMNGLELACASQKEPALGDGLPLLDANFPREEKRGWEELLKIPNSPSRSRRSWGRGWSEERPGQIEHKHHTHLMSLYYRLGRMIVGQRIGKEQLRPSSKLEDTQLPVTQTGQRRERHPSNSPVGGLRVSFVPSCTQA